MTCFHFDITLLKSSEWFLSDTIFDIKLIDMQSKQFFHLATVKILTSPTSILLGLHQSHAHIKMEDT